MKIDAPRLDASCAFLVNPVQPVSTKRAVVEGYRQVFSREANMGKKLRARGFAERGLGDEVSNAMST